MNGLEFEGLVYAKMVEISKDSQFEDCIEQTTAHAFPDIVARKLYGVEVKMTTGDKWISTGNSVLETTRIESVENIYMFFGKFGNKFEVRYRPYQECLYDIGVTHSLRYKINMELSIGQSIFEKMEVSYDVFRKDENSIQKLKEYYRKQLKEGEELWWIDPTSEENSVSPVITSFQSLEQEVKDRFINEVFVLFPEVLGSKRTKFERAAAYLITEYNSVSASLRDLFSAGGKVNIQLQGKRVKVSQVFYKLFLRSRDIEQALNEIPKERLAYYWDIKIISNPLITWKDLVFKYSGKKGLALTVFEEGLKNEQN
jgi:hypothetical protein